MRILHLSRFFHPHVGGTENHIAHLAEAMLPYGIESEVLCTGRRRDEDGPPPRIPVHTVASVGPDRLPLPLPSLRRLAATAATADVLHVHDLRGMLELALLLGRRTGRPTVVSSHGFVFHTPAYARLKRLAWSSYYRSLLSRTHTVLCESDQDLDACRRIGLENVVRVVPPVPVRRFERIRRDPAGTGALVYFGRLAPNKGLERLAPVLEAAPASWTLTLVGSGPSRFVDGLRARFARVSARVRFVPSADDEALAGILAGADCVVLPSRYEGFGMTLVEAMASGSPVVAADIPPYREIAGGSPVRLADFDRADAVRVAVEEALGAWDAAAARERARTFSWDEYAPRFAELYRAVTA